MSRCERCWLRRNKDTSHPTLCSSCVREPAHVLELSGGHWVRDGLVWRWEGSIQEPPRKKRRRKRRPTREPVPLRPCGTHAAYMRHKRHGEEPCPECAEARRIYNAEHMRRIRAQQLQEAA